MSFEIWHNPRCTKSRQTLALLEAKTDQFTIVDYQHEKFTQKRLKDVAGLLGLAPRDMMRTKDDLYKELSLQDASNEALFKAMSENPKLIERPIVIKDNKHAIIGRPPENIEKLF